MQFYSPSGQYLAQDGHCIFVQFEPFDLSQFSDGLFGSVTERIDISCLNQIGNDRLCSVLRSERIHQVSNLGHSSLILKCCILWYSLHTEINVKEVSLGTRLLAGLFVVPQFNTIFGTGRGVRILWHTILSPELFRCSQAWNRLCQNCNPFSCAPN